MRIVDLLCCRNNKAVVVPFNGAISGVAEESLRRSKHQDLELVLYREYQDRAERSELRLLPSDSWTSSRSSL